MTVSAFLALERTIAATDTRRLMDAAQAAVWPHVKKQHAEDMWRRWQQIADPPAPRPAPGSLFSWNGRPVTPIDLRRHLAGHLGAGLSA